MIIDLWCKDQVAQFEVGTSQVLYKLISITGLVFITLSYSKARTQPITIWIFPSLGWLITFYFSLVSLILITAAYVPNSVITLKLKDSVLVGVNVWAVFHLTIVASLA
jgi:uncharacterized membrane protein